MIQRLKTIRLADEVAEVWWLYLDDLNIPRSALKLVMKNYNSAPLSESVRSRIHRLVDEVDESKLVTLEPILLMMKGG